MGSVHTSDGRFFKTGLPSGFFDLFGFRPEDGKIFFIEVKNETGKPREDQIRFHEMLQDNYIIHGLLVLKIRLGDKLNRVSSLIKKNKLKENDESLEDTLLDLA